MAGDDGCIVGQREKTLVDGAQKLASVSSGEVGAADGAGEECVPGEKERLGRDVETDAAFSVAGGMDDGAGEAGDGDELAILEGVVGGRDGGGGDAEPTGLNVHHFDQREIVLVVEDGGTGELLEPMGSGDVVDVGVGDDDFFDGESVGGEGGHDARNVVAGINYDGFVGVLVSEDGAVALQRTDGEDLVDHRVWPSRVRCNLSCEMKDAQAGGLRISED
jgi:hypothetical protein